MISRSCLASLFAMVLSGSACSSEPVKEEAPLVQRLGVAAGRLSQCLGLPSSHVVGYLGSPTLGGASEETKACLESAKDCSGVLRCAGYEVQACEPGCEGEVARNCIELPNGVQVAMREDCSENEHGNTSCALITEDKGNYALCHRGMSCSESRCDGTMGLFCDKGHEVAYPCEPNELCLSDGVGTSCLRDVPCERDHCDESGETAVICDRGRVAIEVRCETELPGTRCVESLASTGCEARVTDPACVADAFGSFCDGNLAVACENGVRYEFDCFEVEGRCVEQDRAATCQ